jgi:hypothetical protein
MSISRAQLRELLLDDEIPSYNNLMSVRGFQYEHGVVYTEGQCYMNSIFNMKRVWQYRDLHLVYGSLGLGRQQNPFFEFGGANWNTINDFTSSPHTKTDAASRTSLDAHVWLEDANGKVYDCVTRSMRHVCQVRNLPPIDSSLTVAQGLTKTELRQRGLYHVPAPPAVQLHLARIFAGSWNLTYSLYMKHCYQRVYDINMDQSP